MEAIRSGIEPENVCVRGYEELIQGEPSFRVVHRDEDEPAPEVIEED